MHKTAEKRKRGGGWELFHTGVGFFTDKKREEGPLDLGVWHCYLEGICCDVLDEDLGKAVLEVLEKHSIGMVGKDEAHDALKDYLEETTGGELTLNMDPKAEEDQVQEGGTVTPKTDPLRMDAAPSKA